MNKSMIVRLHYVLVCIGLLIPATVFSGDGLFRGLSYALVGIYLGYSINYAKKVMPVGSIGHHVLNMISLSGICMFIILAVSAKVIERYYYSKYGLKNADELFITPMIFIASSYAVFSEIRMYLSKKAV